MNWKVLIIFRPVFVDNHIGSTEIKLTRDNINKILYIITVKYVIPIHFIHRSI